MVMPPAEGELDENGVLIDAEDNVTMRDGLKCEDLGTLAKIVREGGEENLIGGIGFFTVGISCKATANQEGPAAGSFVKLSLKMKAFHALHLISEGVSRISYQSKDRKSVV